MAMNVDTSARNQVLMGRLQQTFASSEWPQFLALESVGDCHTIQLYIDHHVRWFDGHFPGQPVLAGVVQTHWAAEIGRLLFAIEDQFVRIDNLKFQAIIMAEQKVNLHLQYFAAAKAFKFRYEYAESAFSEGKFVFAEQ